MFEKDFVSRMTQWRSLRSDIDRSNNPIQDVLDFWNQAPTSRIASDPYDDETWPNPWEMIKENIYCDFTKILAIYYTLQLTERFSQSVFEIHIVLDKEESDLKYLLFVDNQVIGYYNDRSVDIQELPTLQCQMRYDNLPSYH